ncbi:hypothetical protein LG202_15550 [Methylobacillus methanolivorans]
MRAYTYQAEYFTKASELSEKKAERLLSRMSVCLYSELLRDAYSPHEILAIQLQIEDEQLQEWRQRVAQLRQQEQVWLSQGTPLTSPATVN